MLQVLKIMKTRFCSTGSDDLKNVKFLQPSAEDSKDEGSVGTSSKDSKT